MQQSRKQKQKEKRNATTRSDNGKGNGDTGSPLGVWKTRRKQPASLIRLEEGIEVTMDDDGWPVIRRVIERAEEGENASEVRAVVSDDERAQ